VEKQELKAFNDIADFNKRGGVPLIITIEDKKSVDKQKTFLIYCLSQQKKNYHNLFI